MKYLSNKKYVIGSLFTALVVLGCVFFLHKPSTVLANTTLNAHGFLWSDMPDGSDECIHGSGTESPNRCGSQTLYGPNPEAGRGFGWISLNSSDTLYNGNPTGLTASNLYLVSLDTTTGDLSGYGWSENGGWVDFSPTTGYPKAAGTIPADAHGAQVDPTCLASGGTSCSVTGWIRFVAGEDNNPNDTGSWDGWVSLSSGGGIAYGVTYDSTTGDFSGLAWGGMDAGWIDFSKAYTDKGTPPPPPPQTVDVCENPAAINYTPGPYSSNDVNTPTMCLFKINPPPPPITVNICEDPTATNYTAPTSRSGYPPSDSNDPSMCTYNTCETPKDLAGNGATNYVPGPYTTQQISDPSSCIFIGCMDKTATNYDPQATVDTNPSSCIYSGTGTTGGNTGGPTVPINPGYRED
jgi:hypothetical protein